MNCILCYRNSLGKYCSFHMLAFKKISLNYEIWRHATSINWKEYLREIEKNPNSGKWVVEVAQHLITKYGDCKS